MGFASGVVAATAVAGIQAAIGGPLAWVQSGDRIRLDVEKRELMLLVPDEEMSKRKRDKPLQEPKGERGYRQLFLKHVTQADQGVDFDFLRKTPE